MGRWNWVWGKAMYEADIGARRGAGLSRGPEAKRPVLQRSGSGAQRSGARRSLWGRWLWAGLALGAVLGLFLWAARSDPPGPKNAYLYGTESLAQEAAYCLAVAQRVGEITHGLGPAKLEFYLQEQRAFWIARLEGLPMAELLAQARGALGRDSHAPDVDEQAHLHLAVQDCGMRSLALGARLRPLE